MSVDTYLCPGCDKEVPVGTRGCPYCNPPTKPRKRRKAAVRRSRGEAAGHDFLDLPDDDFDYDDFIAREFGHTSPRRTGLKWYWWVTAISLLVLIVLAGFTLGGWGRNIWQ